MFSGFMVNAWEIGSIVAVVGGVVGFFVVLRGAAFEAHAIPNGAFAGAAGASLIGVSTLLGLGVFAVGAAVAIAFLSRRGRPDVVTALALVMMLALGAAFLSQTTQYEPEIYSLLFGEVLGVSSGEILPVAGLGLVCARCHRRAVPAAAAHFTRPGDCRRHRSADLPDRARVPRHRGAGHHHDRSGGRSTADLLADDRPPGSRQVHHRPTRRRPRWIGGDRTRHDLDGDRRCLCDGLASGILRRGPQRRVVRRRSRLRSRFHPEGGQGGHEGDQRPRRGPKVLRARATPTCPLAPVSCRRISG